MAAFLFLGLHDTENDVFDPDAPNFKRLRQQDLDGEFRREKEAVSLELSWIHAYYFF